MFSPPEERLKTSSPQNDKRVDLQLSRVQKVEIQAFEQRGKRSSVLKESVKQNSKNKNSALMGILSPGGILGKKKLPVGTKGGLSALRKTKKETPSFQEHKGETLIPQEDRSGTLSLQKYGNKDVFQPLG